MSIYLIYCTGPQMSLVRLKNRIASAYTNLSQVNFFKRENSVLE